MVIASGEAPAPLRRPQLVVVGAGLLACVALVLAARPIADPSPAAAPVPGASTSPAASAPAQVGPQPSGTPTPGPSRTRTTSPTPAPIHSTGTPSAVPGAEPVAGRSGCHVRYTKRNEWDPGFIVDVTVANTGTTAVDGWTLDFAFTAGQTLLSAWSATVTQAGTDVTASDGGISPTIAPGASVTFGIQGTWHGSDSVPPAFTLNDTRCT